MLLEDVGEHVGVNHIQKVFRKGTMVITTAKHQAVAALRYAVLAVANFATLFRGVGESCFLSKKKLPKGIKDLKSVKSGDLKTKGRLSLPKNVSPSLLRDFR